MAESNFGRPIVSESDLTHSILLTSEAFTEDYHRLMLYLDRLAPVWAEFVIKSTPPGIAPEEIREQWIGLTLPVRCYGLKEEEVPVLARDALEILRAKKPSAYEWWVNYYALEAAQLTPQVESEGFPEFLANISFLVFNAECGDVT